VIRIFDYIKFYAKSKTNHGVHSPFVYDLITSCFFNEKWIKERKSIFTKENLKSNSLYIIKKLKEFIKNYNEYNQSNLIILNIYSRDNHLKLIEKLNKKHTQFILFIGNCQNLRPTIKAIEKEKTYMLIDFYFWALVLKKKDNQPEYFKIRVL